MCAIFQIALNPLPFRLLYFDLIVLSLTKGSAQALVKGDKKKVVSRKVKAA
jgi:hypothetical protein